MSIINKNPKKQTRESGKGLIRSKSNFNSMMSKSKRNIETENQKVYTLPRRDRLGRVINKQFEPINTVDSNYSNVVQMRRIKNG